MSAQPGFFGRIKNNFTQYAAGTDDLSQLSETQQKLLRREALGRLGASLYRNGDFGEAMQQQGEINAKRLEQRQAEEQARRISEAWTPEQSIIASPGGVGAPQVPTLLNPASTNAAPGQPRQLPAQQPAQQPAAAPASASQPGMTAGTGGDLISARAYYEGVGRRLAAIGQREHAQLALDMAKHYAPNEKISYQEVLGADGRPRLLQTGEYGTMRETNYRPRETAEIEQARTYLGEPELLGPELRLRAAGATRVDARSMPTNVWDREFAAGDAQRFGELRKDAEAAAGAISSLDALNDVLSSTQTGVVPGLIATASRVFGGDAGASLEQAEAYVVPLVAAEARAFGTGNGFTDKDREFLVNAQPGMFKTKEANEALYRFLRARAIRRVQRYQSANAHRRQYGNTMDWEDPMFGGDTFTGGGGQPAPGTPTDDWDY